MAKARSLPMRFHLPFFLTLISATGALAAEPPAGHSAHGEAFNEGPRQAAVLMGGTGEVHFPSSTKSGEAQAFFEQGVGQLHGFWYFEAERSFRQAATLDPDCAMFYWGMAMANVNNKDRAKGFLAKAVERKDKATDREKLWIKTLENYYQEDKRDDKQRELDFIRDLEEIVQSDPTYTEAKAFLAWKIWHAKSKAPISSPMAVNALLDQVFEASPNHPAHHYRIHLWDGFKPSQALKSAAVLGQSAPSIAHMWHMPGHIFSKLKRYDDAAWQQEASTRVDHAYMMKNLILPDQIHNYAHNEEWLVRTFNELGRASDAVALAKSLIANPRHPKINTLDKGSSSASYGRTRLIDTLIQWERWSQLEELCRSHSPWLPKAVQEGHEALRLRGLGLAQFHLDRGEALDTTIAELKQFQVELKQKKIEDAKDEAKPKAEKPKEAASPAAKAKGKGKGKAGAGKKNEAKPKASDADKALAELQILAALIHEDADSAKKQLLTIKDEIPADRLARYWLAVEDPQKAIETANKINQNFAGLSTKASILALAGKPEDARKTIDQVRKVSFAADPTLPVAARLDALVESLDVKNGWRGKAPIRKDSGVRPELDTLGPIHWSPPMAPKWMALDLDLNPVNAATLERKPTLLIFYLGQSCTHCMEQMEAVLKRSKDLEKAGLQLVGVTPEPPSLAKRILDKHDVPFPIYCDPSLDMFRAFRAHDDFEQLLLHCVALIDSKNRIRWIDISYDPFMDLDFLIQESQRLLRLE